MILKVSLTLLLISYCFGGSFYDFIVRKDEGARKLLSDPEGIDTDMFNAMKSVGDSFEMLTQFLRSKNTTYMADSRLLFERGLPLLLAEVFSTDSLKVFYGWGESDLDYFNHVYSDVQDKWDAFSRVFRNVSSYL